MWIRNIGYLFFLLLLCPYSFSQADSTIRLRFDFNDHNYREAGDQLTIKPVGVTLTKDRFGNKNSAVYVHGNASSYLNLGTSNLLKPRIGTIALWVNLQNIMLTGKGYGGNPFFIIRNAPVEDFDIGCGIGYNWSARRMGAQVSRDSLKEVTAFAKDTTVLNTWYHLAITYNNNYFAFYVNGELEAKLSKGFESIFLENDSVVLGRTTGFKNERYVNAIFDDICFYHRVLSPQEIEELYNEPNPNKLKNTLFEVFKYGIVIIILCCIIIIILIRNRMLLKKQKKFYELSYLHHRIRELEIKVIKTQMNPHFISNCLSAIQDLIYSGQIDKAGEYLAKFNVFLRQVLDSSDKHYLTLEKELDMIRLNVELEQLRFKNEFSFHIHIQEGIILNEILVPALITQPFIENAIWHGLLPLKERQPSLTVRIYEKGGCTYLTIEDNGVGRSNTGTNKNPKGIKLVADKIESMNQFRNSNDFKLEIVDLSDENRLPAGTKVIIQLLTHALDE
jgi:hypothetical protein